MTRKPRQTVRIAELKAKLSEYLRAARDGDSVTVCDRDTPVARLVPYEAGAGGGGEALSVRRPLRSLRDVVLPPRLGRRVDSLRELQRERQSSR